jgi:RNA polymerase sigma factor (sigma-70 family)
MSPTVDARVLAALRNVTPATVLAWARRGWIPCARVGRRVWFDVAEVERALKVREAQRKRPGRRGAPSMASPTPGDPNDQRRSAGTALRGERRGLARSPMRQGPSEPFPQSGPLPALDFDEETARLIRAKARKLARSPGFSWQDTEDLAQDLAVKALEARRGHDPALGPLGAFLAVVLSNHAVDLLRRRQAQRRRDRRPTSLSATVAWCEGERRALAQMIGQRELDARIGKHTRPDEEQADERMDVAAALARLPPEQRRLAEALSRGSCAEVARAAGIPRTTLRARVAHLRPAFGGGDPQDFSPAASSGPADSA